MLEAVDGALDYQVGDSLGIAARNDPGLVAAIIERLGASPDTPVQSPDGVERPLAKALNAKDLQQKMLSSGAELVPDDLMTSKGFGDYIQKEFAVTREAAKIAGLTPT